MIRKPTVLILGAGASHPYGYPLGGDLVQEILRLTGPGGDLRTHLEYEDDPDVERFHTRLKESDVASIDDFLESNPDLAELGKVAIAAALTVWGPQPNYVPKPGQHWYRYLWGRLHEGARTSDEFCNNRIAFITYNYDRSLERYLRRVLVNMYPDLAESEAEALKILTLVLPVLHLHGSLGKQEDVVRGTGERGQFAKLPFFRTVASGIRIVHEAESAEYRKAHEWLAEAEAVHVLGFGYHPTNVRRLNLQGQRGDASRWRSCGGTALGFEQAETQRAEAALGLGSGFLRSGEDCLSYLRRFSPLE